MKLTKDLMALMAIILRRYQSPIDRGGRTTCNLIVSPPQGRCAFWSSKRDTDLC